MVGISYRTYCHTFNPIPDRPLYMRHNATYGLIVNPMQTVETVTKKQTKTKL